MNSPNQIAFLAVFGENFGVVRLKVNGEEKLYFLKKLSVKFSYDTHAAVRCLSSQESMSTFLDEFVLVWFPLVGARPCKIYIGKSLRYV